VPQAAAVLVVEEAGDIGRVADFLEISFIQEIPRLGKHPIISSAKWRSIFGPWNVQGISKSGSAVVS